MCADVLETRSDYAAIHGRGLLPICDPEHPHGPVDDWMRSRRTLTRCSRCINNREFVDCFVKDCRMAPTDGTITQGKELPDCIRFYLKKKITHNLISLVQINVLW